MGVVRTVPPSICLILPAYNEADRIEQTMGSIARYMAGGAGGAAIGPVIVADDGSTDATQEVARAAAAANGLAVEILALPHRGKALTVRDAMLHAASRVDAEYLMMLDADDELRIDQLDRVAWSEDPQTVYIGRRVDTIEGEAGATPTPIRRLMSATMRLASRVLLGIRFPDTQCGFKLFPRAIVPALFGQQRSSGWTFDAELLYIAHRVSGLPVREVPVVWVPRGTSRVRPLAAVLSGLAMFGTAARRIRGVYRRVGVAPGASSTAATVRR